MEQIQIPLFERDPVVKSVLQAGDNQRDTLFIFYREFKPARLEIIASEECVKHGVLRDAVKVRWLPDTDTGRSMAGPGG